MSQVTFTPSKDYSMIHTYSYQGKSYFSEGIDYATYFLRLALGSDKIQLTAQNQTWLAEKTTPNYPLHYAVRIGVLALSLFFYRCTVVSFFALGVKYFLCNEQKKLTELSSGFQQRFKTPPNLAPNKAYIYKQLKQGVNIADDPIQVKIISIPQSASINQISMFPARETKLQLDAIGGPYRFDESRDSVQHWIANYTTPETSFFNESKNDNLSSEEQLCLEHPVLYHLHSASKKPLGKNEITLIEGALRHGKLDMTKIVAPNIDGEPTLTEKNFAKATQEQLIQCLTICENPKESKIFSLAEPKEDIEESFYRIFTAFKAIKEAAATNAVHIHIRNTEKNKLQNLVLFIAIARLTGIDKINFYDQKKPDTLLKEACKIHNQIKTDHPNFTTLEFISHIKTLAI